MKACAVNCRKATFTLPDATCPSARAQKCRFCARKARKRGFRIAKAHKNPDFVLGRGARQYSEVASVSDLAHRGVAHRRVAHHGLAHVDWRTWIGAPRSSAPWSSAQVCRCLLAGCGRGAGNKLANYVSLLCYLVKVAIFECFPYSILLYKPIIVGTGNLYCSIIFCRQE